MSEPHESTPRKTNSHSQEVDDYYCLSFVLGLGQETDGPTPTLGNSRAVKIRVDVRDAIERADKGPLNACERAISAKATLQVLRDTSHVPPERLVTREIVGEAMGGVIDSLIVPLVEEMTARVRLYELEWPRPLSEQ